MYAIVTKRFAAAPALFTGANVCLRILGLLFLLSSGLMAQEIPLGTWRAHVSYNAIVAVDVTDQAIYAAASNGVMVVNRADRSMETFNKINAGLSGEGITDVQFDIGTKQLLITYEDGKFDMIKAGSTSSFDPTANAPVTGSKKITSISLRNGLAYLSTDYGMVVVDLARNQVKETWRDLGPLGTTLKIFQSTFKQDSIFLATEKGIIAGDMDDNLLDFSAWKRFDTGELNAPVEFITFFDDEVYASINETGIFSHGNGAWSKESFLQDLDYTSLTASAAFLYVTEGANLWRLDDAEQLSQVVDDKITRPVDVHEDAAGNMWLGDGLFGLVSNAGGIFNHYIPNGPSTIVPLRLKYAQGKMYLLPGGYSSTFQPLRKAGVLNLFGNGVWTSEDLTVDDLTDLEISYNGDRYVASFGYGIEKTAVNGDVTVFNEDNSTLINLNPPGDFVNVSSIELATDGLWVANYGAATPLHRLSDETHWESFSFPFAAARYPVELAIDQSGYVWALLNPAEGGGVLVFDMSSGGHEYLTEGVGNGGLPNKAVRSLAVDRDGLIWLGTELGVCYFFTPSEDAIRPIFENRFLLRDDKVTAIAVDGGNRKWMGTERGVWLFDPSCETLIYNFTTENSPLLSNVVHDIEINQETGEVFFATSRGIVSFRSDATASDAAFRKIKIFPNPVTSTFTGTVGISGLATDAVVKITDISGKLVWETRANGGTATWNVRDYNGNRAATGIYIVFAAAEDGSESAVGKIAVVN